MRGLKRLESLIEQIVEEPFVRIFAGRLLPQEVAARLVRALEEVERPGPDGRMEVPGRYRIDLHPDDLLALQAEHPHLAEDLAIGLQSLMRRMQVKLRRPPVVILRADPDLPAHEVRITPLGDDEQTEREHTRDLDLSRVKKGSYEESLSRPQAYLIIEGEETFDLDQPLIRMGRSLDNELVLKDPRVSRHHAQLRQRYGRYILQDLQSTGGTTVNGFAIRETVLRPGDLISLAGVDLLYIETGAGQSSDTRSGDTEPFPTEA